MEINHDKVAAVADFVAKAKEAQTNKKPALLLVQRGGATLYTVIKPAEGQGARLIEQSVIRIERAAHRGSRCAALVLMLGVEACDGILAKI